MISMLNNSRRAVLISPNLGRHCCHPAHTLDSRKVRGAGELAVLPHAHLSHALVPALQQGPV